MENKQLNWNWTLKANNSKKLPEPHLNFEVV